MKYSISEVLKAASEASTINDRVDILKRNDSYPIRTVLKFALDPNIKWALPEGEPPYKPTDYIDQATMLIREARRLYLFLDPATGGHQTLKQVKREQLYIELLESVDKEDAKLLIAIKDKKLPYPNLVPRTINKAFPDLLPEEAIVDVDENYEVIETGRKNQGFGSESPEDKAKRLAKSLETRRANKALKEEQKAKMEERLSKINKE